MTEKMFIVVSPMNPDPMYKQVMDQIKEAIASNLLKPEDKLPSIREMSRELRISEITIKRAYTDLEREGYISTRAGLGSFVADISPEKMRREILSDIRNQLEKILKTGEKYDIGPTDVIDLLRSIDSKKET